LERNYFQGLKVGWGLALKNLREEGAGIGKGGPVNLRKLWGKKKGPSGLGKALGPKGEGFLGLTGGEFSPEIGGQTPNFLN